MNRPGLSEEFINCKSDQIINFSLQLLKYNKKTTKIGICTGFYIKNSQAPETDGPTSSINLANVLFQLNFEKIYLFVDKINQNHFINLINELKTKYTQLNKIKISSDPKELDLCEIQIFIEKAGKNRQNKNLSMRAIDISEFCENWTPNDQSLSLGIGDGGNEIGCGNLKFSNLVPNEIKCIQATKFTILSDISNLGGFLLSYSISLISGHLNEIQFLDEKFCLQKCVEAGFVDGVVGSVQETVDNMDSQLEVKQFVHFKNILEYRLDNILLRYGDDIGLISDDQLIRLRIDQLGYQICFRLQL